MAARRKINETTNTLGIVPMNNIGVVGRGNKKDTLCHGDKTPANPNDKVTKKLRDGGCCHPNSNGLKNTVDGPQIGQSKYESPSASKAADKITKPINPKKGNRVDESWSFDDVIDNIVMESDVNKQLAFNEYADANDSVNMMEFDDILRDAYGAMLESKGEFIDLVDNDRTHQFIMDENADGEVWHKINEATLPHSPVDVATSIATGGRSVDLFGGSDGDDGELEDVVDDCEVNESDMNEEIERDEMDDEFDYGIDASDYPSDEDDDFAGGEFESDELDSDEFAVGDDMTDIEGSFDVDPSDDDDDAEDDNLLIDDEINEEIERDEMDDEFDYGIDASDYPSDEDDDFAGGEFESDELDPDLHEDMTCTGDVAIGHGAFTAHPKRPRRTPKNKRIKEDCDFGKPEKTTIKDKYYDNKQQGPQKPKKNGKIKAKEFCSKAMDVKSDVKKIKDIKLGDNTVNNVQEARIMKDNVALIRSGVKKAMEDMLEGRRGDYDVTFKVVCDGRLQHEHSDLGKAAMMLEEACMMLPGIHKSLQVIIKEDRKVIDITEAKLSKIRRRGPIVAENRVLFSHHKTAKIFTESLNKTGRNCLIENFNRFVAVKGSFDRQTARRLFESK